MMRRTQAFEYLVEHYYVDELSHEDFDELMLALIDTPHKPWCRTRMSAIAPNYGADCTCGEDSNA